MSQHNKRKAKDPRKGAKKTDLGKSSKQGVSMSAQASEEKTKVSQLAKAEGSKAMSSTSKPSEKPGLATSHKSADSSKGKPTVKMDAANSKITESAQAKPTSGPSAKPSGATGGKQQQPQTKMGQKVTKTAQMDTKEKLVKTLPSMPSTSAHKTTDPKFQSTKQSCNTDTENANSVPFKEDLLQKHSEDIMKLVTDTKSQIMTEVTHMIEEQIHTLKTSIVKSLESGNMEQKKAVIATLENVSEVEDKKPMLSPMEQLMETLPSQEPDPSIPKYTSPEVKEPDDSKKKAELVGETEESIPPDYRYTEQADPKEKGKMTSSSTHPEKKTKSMTEGQVLDSLSADFGSSSPAAISKCSAATSYSALPPSMQKQVEDPFDLLAGTLPSEAPDNSAPKYTGAAVKESDATKKKAERVGETEGSIPPDYRFKEQPDPKAKGNVASSSTGPGAKPKVTGKSMTEGEVLDCLSADFVHSSAAPVLKCSAATSHSAAPPSMQKQVPQKASTVASVSASKSDAKDEDPFDLLAGMLPSEALDNSAPQYTGPVVKESDAAKKKAELVGETEGSIPPDYRFKEQPDPKDKGKVASSSTSPGAKPKVTEKSMTEGEVLDSLSTDFGCSSPAPISKCSAATSHSAAPPSMPKQAPLKASLAASVSASKSDAKDEDPFDLLAETLPSEAPDNSAPKYIGPSVKEADATKKKAELVGETEGSIPPDYRFKEQPDPKGKGKMASSSTGPGAKPKGTEKSMTEGDVLDCLSSDFVHTSAAPISKCSAATSHSAAPPSIQKQAPLKASTAASASASQSGTKSTDALDLLAETLPSEAPDNSAPKYTGPEVKESDSAKKKAELVGETEESIPPDYRFKELPDAKDKGKLASSTGPGAKPKATEKSMTEGDVHEYLSADFVHSSAAPISNCSAATSHSAAPPSMQKQASLKASTAVSVSASQSGKKGKDPLDLLAETLPSEDNSAPKYTGPEVKESDADKKKAEQVGETEGSIPPDYRFKEHPDPKGKVASSSSGPGAKPKVTEKSVTKGEVLDFLSADFVHSSAAPISICSAATSHSAAPPSMQKQPLLKASTAVSVSASQSSTKENDPFDLLARTLPSEALDNSAPKYTGSAVKESDSTKKKAERVGETEESIPPDYRFKEQPDAKDKGKVASSSTGPGAKPKGMTEGEVMDSLSADFVHSSAAPISKCTAATSHSAAPPSMQKQAPLQTSTAASVSASKSDTKDEDPFNLLAETLPSEAPDNSAPKYTGPLVKESDHSKKKAELVGETEESIPPDYRFSERADPKDKSKVASSSTGPGAKPKLQTKVDLVEGLSSDFDSCPSASRSGTQVSKPKEVDHKTGSVSKMASTPKTSDVGLKSPKAKNQSAVKSDARKPCKR